MLKLVRLKASSGDCLVNPEQITYCQAQHAGTTLIRLVDGQSVTVAMTLDELHSLLDCY
jgi:hypothetical protein